MKSEPVPVPPLAELLRWIADIPAAFTEEPAGHPNGKVWVRGVVSDIYETIIKSRPPEDLLQAFYGAPVSKIERNRLRWVLSASWVFWHPYFRQCQIEPKRFRDLMVLDLADLAAIMPVENLLTDQDRREELARLAVATTRASFPGETWEDFKDRLTQVDSIESHRVIAQATLKEKKSSRRPRPP